MRLAVLLLLSLSSACAVRPAYNAYFAFPIKDPKFIERVQALHQAALDVSKEFAPLLVPIEKLQQKMLSFRLDKDEESRDLVNEKTMAELCKILPRRVAYSTFSFAQRSLGNSVVAQSQSYGLALHISTQLLGILDRNGLAYEQKSVPYGTTPYAVLIEGSNKLNVTDIPIGGLELFASAYVDTIYVCRENSASANNFCDVIQEITLKCEEKKKNMEKRVQLLNEAALNVSKDFAPFLVDPTNLVQPLLSIYLEDDDIPRISKIYDTQLQISLCAYLPRRIPYTEFKVVNNSIMAMSQTDRWIDYVKTELLQALNRHGFIYLGNLDMNMILITNPLGTKLVVNQVDISKLKLTASAYIDRLYICRGPAPNPDFAAPCDVVTELPVIKCPFHEISIIAYQHYLMLAHSHS